MKLTLPDKSIRDLDNGSSGFDLASDIGPGLAKAAVAVTVDGVQRTYMILLCKILVFLLSQLTQKKDSKLCVIL